MLCRREKGWVGSDSDVDVRLARRRGDLGHRNRKVWGEVARDWRGAPTSKVPLSLAGYCLNACWRSRVMGICFRCGGRWILFDLETGKEVAASAKLAAPGRPGESRDGRYS